jgi:hypothetical protein
MLKREQIRVSAHVQAQLRAQEVEKATKINAQQDITEIDGFKITAEQCNKINACDREAIEKFIDENAKRLSRLARAVLRRQGISVLWNTSLHRYDPSIVEVGDCINQLYLDLRRGFLVFRLEPHALARIIAHSFSYAGVGGFGDEDGVYLYKPKRCSNVGA